MRLQGDANNLHGMEVDDHVYLLMKKLAFWVIAFISCYMSKPSKVFFNITACVHNALAL